MNELDIPLSKQFCFLCLDWSRRGQCKWHAERDRPLVNYPGQKTGHEECDTDFRGKQGMNCRMKPRIPSSTYTK